MTLGWQQMFTVMLWLSSVLFWLFLILTPPSLLISLSRSRHPPPVHLTLSLRYVLSPPVALGCFSLYFFALCLSLSLSIFPLALSLSLTHTHTQRHTHSHTHTHTHTLIYIYKQTFDR